MKIWILALALTGMLVGEPTESREWTATNGKTVEGSVLRIEGDKVVLKRADGPEVRVPLAIFVEGDRKLLEEHFGIEPGGNAAGSGAEAAEDLPVEQGEVVGPIDAGDGATYYLYLPESLKKDRKVPLLFYTDAGGGSRRQLQGIKEGAEVCGWVTAISVESKNGESVEHNKRVSKACVDHILETLPVDGDRLYFTGNSGGGAMSMFNADDLKGAGGMPNIGYIPQGCDPPKGHYYVLSGGNDFNRYLSAHIGKKFGKDAVHRMHPGGHSGGPNSMRVDGMIWLNARYLEEERRDHADEALDFEAAVISWIRDLAGEEPHRAYSTARVLKDDYAISDTNLGVVEALLGELGAELENVRYHEGLLAIDDFSEDEFAEFGEGGGSKMGHADSGVTRKAEALAEEYRGIPMIEDTFKAMAKATVGG